MNPRSVASRSASHPRASAAFKRGAVHTARFVHANLTRPAASFLVDSVEGVVAFASGFAASARAVEKAMDRAWAERETLSTQRR